MSDPDDRMWRFGWIGTRDAMAYLGVHSENALYRLITDHRLPHGRMGGRYRFRRADLDEWMRHQGVLNP